MKWMAECETKKDVLNLMGMEMIYRLMPTFLSGRVRDLKPSTPREAAGLADTHLHNRGQSAEPEKKSKPERSRNHRPNGYDNNKPISLSPSSHSGPSQQPKSSLPKFD